MIIGLTGGIASGKSTIAKKMSERGAFVLDADKLGHRVYEPGRKAFDQVIEVFGGDIVAETGEIDRKILGGKVFGNPAELKKLTDIVWPAISAMASEEINENRANHPDQLIVVEAAVLIEANWQGLSDEIWVTIVDPAVAIDRASRRDNIEPSAVQARIDAQVSNKERASHADVLIDNSGSEQDLSEAFDLEWEKLQGRLS